MKSSIYLKILLFIVGLIGFSIGIALLFFPVEFEGSAHIYLNRNDFSLLSEIRSSGGTLIVFGAIIVLGAFRSSLTKISLQTAILLYFAYGFSRLYSIIVDGIPSSTIFNAAIAEIAIGIICTIFYLKHKE
ncbi:hypothetical protein HNP37_001622 [Flavobacterium nitrogenifigens]|uniref:DUF4345 domain-containing protein n=2 Tax=Flavobacterium TaxID=237 RepID=A0A7W7IVX3_9FLAO|nr:MULTISPECIES: DUF4345 domain-containing protein [Flavobacterium]MBB4801561.1 hypothetical protein [Flavobacterium nitrogenifigens]MBB6386518.1 hypothetical protein [Flavobacterium notoginsengisoli]